MSSLKTLSVACPVRFTEGALVEIRSLISRSGVESGKALRIGVKGGGCSGLSYLLDFDQAGPNDQEFDCEGIRVLMDPAHALYLDGMEIHYSEGLDNRGFTFNNPNASATCGCGTSFSA